MSIYNKLVFGKYKFIKLIGKGSFGYVLKGKNVVTDEEVAIKVEEWKNVGNILEGEAYFLFYLKGFGIPEVKSFGIYGKYKVLVQTLLGNSLEDIFCRQNYKFTLKDISMIAIQLLDRLEFIHSKYIIHRDLKPENIMVDFKSKRIIYLIDFGLAKKYRSGRTGKHIKFRVPRRLTGTARYASVNALRGTEQSRRDDLESAGYVLIYFALGYLPWQRINVSDKLERYKKYFLLKKEIKFEDLCKGLPHEFVEYMKYVRGLQFEEQPNYKYLRGLFLNIINRIGANDLFFSWLSKNEMKKKVYIPDSRSNSLSKRKNSPQERLLRNIKNSREKEKNLKKIDKNVLLSELEEKQEQREKEYILKKEKNNLKILNNIKENNAKDDFCFLEKEFKRSKNETQLAYFNKSVNMEELEEDTKDIEKTINENINKKDNVKKENKNKKNNNFNTINNRPITFNISNGSFNNARLIKCLSQYNIKINFLGNENHFLSRNKRTSITKQFLTEEFIQSNIISKIKGSNNKIENININKENSSNKISHNILKNSKRKNIKLEENKINILPIKNILGKNKKKLQNNFPTNNNIYKSPISNINNIKENKMYYNVLIERKNLSQENQPKKGLKRINLRQISNKNNNNYSNYNIQPYNLSNNNSQKFKNNNFIINNNRINNNSNIHNNLINYNSIFNRGNKFTSENKNIILSNQNSSNNILNKLNASSKSLENNFHNKRKFFEGKLINKLSIQKNQKSFEKPTNKCYNNGVNFINYNNYIKNQINKSNKNIHPNKTILIYKKTQNIPTQKIKIIRLTKRENSDIYNNNNYNKNYKSKYVQVKYMNKNSSANNLNYSRKNIFNNSYINSTNNNFNFNIVNNNNNSFRQNIKSKYFCPNYNLNTNNNINITLSNNNFIST